MFFRSFSTLRYILIAVSLGAPSAVFGSVGPGGTGGGTTLALEFKQALAQGLRDLKEIDFQAYDTLMTNGIEKASENATVIVENEPLQVDVSGHRQDCFAINVPAERLIIVNERMWLAENNRFLREAIAVHEYASLLGLEHTGFYPISGKIADATPEAPDFMSVNFGINQATTAKVCGFEIADIDRHVTKSLCSFSSVDVQLWAADSQTKELRVCVFGDSVVLAASRKSGDIWAMIFPPGLPSCSSFH